MKFDKRLTSVKGNLLLLCCSSFKKEKIYKYEKEKVVNDVGLLFACHLLRLEMSLKMNYVKLCFMGRNEVKCMKKLVVKKCS